jgi:hypothetical protein
MTVGKLNPENRLISTSDSGYLVGQKQNIKTTTSTSQNTERTYTIINYFEGTPKEINEYIFSFFSLSSLFTVSQVSVFFNAIASSPALFKIKAGHAGRSLPDDQIPKGQNLLNLKIIFGMIRPDFNKLFYPKHHLDIPLKENGAQVLSKPKLEANIECTFKSYVFHLEKNKGKELFFLD